jgi:protein-S-isoprenylcysteine O-methyltransferase Ste14
MPEFPKPYADFVARLRVPSGFLIVAVFALLSRPTAQSLLIGVPVSIAGLALRAWAAGCLAKDRQLSSSGPYAYTRNPLYLGTLIVALGLVIASRNWILGALFAAVFVFIYLPVIQLEQQHLRKLFPDYADYVRHVPALLPRFTPSQRPNPRPFQMALYVKNREYQAAIGLAVGILFLLWKLA